MGAEMKCFTPKLLKTDYLDSISGSVLLLRGAFLLNPALNLLPNPKVAKIRPSFLVQNRKLDESDHDNTRYRHDLMVTGEPVTSVGIVYIELTITGCRV